MMPMNLRVWLMALLAILLTVAPGPRDADASDPSLVEQLRAGGHVLVFRHAATDSSQKDVDLRDLEQCSTQRNLSDHGREQAAMIGRELRRLQVPVGAVLASPYCRTRETALLAFERADVSADLVSQTADDAPAERERLTMALRSLLAQPPLPGTNTVLVTHFLNINDATFLDIEEGEAIIVAPDGAGGFTVVGQVKADGWGAFPLPEAAVVPGGAATRSAAPTVPGHGVVAAAGAPSSAMPSHALPETRLFRTYWTSTVPIIIGCGMQ